MPISRAMQSVMFGAFVLPVLLVASPTEESGSESPKSKVSLELPKPPARIADAAVQARACLECHTEMVDLLIGDKHIADDFHCVVCHGESKRHLEMEQEGDLPDRAWRRWIEEENGFQWRMKNASLEIAKYCASCHDVKPAEGQEIKTMNWKAYLATGHGQAVAEGDHDAATCTDCHYAHGAGAEPLTDQVVIGRCALCHADKQMMDLAGIDPNVMKDFAAKTHETMDVATDEENASCIQCHYPH